MTFLYKNLDLQKFTYSWVYRLVNYCFSSKLPRYLMLMKYVFLVA